MFTAIGFHKKLAGFRGLDGLGRSGGILFVIRISHCFSIGLDSVGCITRGRITNWISNRWGGEKPWELPFLWVVYLS